MRSRREAPASRLGSLALSKARMPLALAVGESVTVTAVAFTVGKLRVMARGSPREALSEEPERSASGHPPRRRADSPRTESYTD